MAIIKTVQTKAGLSAPSVVKTTAGFTVLPEHEMNTAQPVKLWEATKMYQPVTASSVGSKYFVVALRPDLKLAARYIEGRLSVRAEGTGLPNYFNAFIESGFNAGTGYYSLHVQVGGDKMLSRTLGSILLGLNVDFTLVAGMPAKLIGKGEAS